MGHVRAARGLAKSVRNALSAAAKNASMDRV
jgi:pantothenate synthetase